LTYTSHSHSVHTPQPRAHSPLRCIEITSSREQSMAFTFCPAQSQSMDKFDMCMQCLSHTSARHVTHVAANARVARAMDRTRYGEAEGDTQPLNPKPLFAAPTRRRAQGLHPDATRRAWRKKVGVFPTGMPHQPLWLVHAPSLSAHRLCHKRNPTVATCSVCARAASALAARAVHLCGLVLRELC
jgi:hypothetical protein